jgi:tetratricopeptide (TPR) repeat protein
MTLGKFLLGTALLGAALPAAAAVTVLGSTSARLCYESAETPGAASLSALGRCDEALSEDMITERDRIATHVNRGIIRLRRGELDAAVADFDTAIARDPKEAEAYLNKGMAMLRREDGASAIGLFDTALAKKTSRPEIAYYGRAVAHEMSGRVAAAYRDYREANRLAPEWEDPRVELARFTVRQR